jgi:hypothetical protein
MTLHRIRLPLPLLCCRALVSGALILSTGCSAQEDATSASSDFTGYQTVSGYSREAFTKDFSPGLLIVSEETSILQGQGSRIIGAAGHQGFCKIAHNNGGLVTMSRPYLIKTTDGFAILPEDIDFMRFTAPGEADILTVRMRLSDYEPHQRRVSGRSSFTLYCQHSQFDEDQTMPTAAAIADALKQGMTGSYIKFIPSSSPLSGPALTPQ